MSKWICSEYLIVKFCYGTIVDETHKEDFCDVLFSYDAILVDISAQEVLRKSRSKIAQLFIYFGFTENYER